MIFLYNLGIRTYYLLALITSLFKPKARLWVKGRKNVFKQLKSELETEKKYCWFHASSLGEFEQGRPIIEEIKKTYPEMGVVLTFFSPSGYEIRKNYTGADIICYLPLDTRRNAQRFMKLVKPKWCFFIKYDYWFHFLKQAKKSGSKIFLVSGIFRKKQLFFKSYGNWYRKLLNQFDHLFIQNNESASLLESIGIKNYTVSGDSRFDRVVQIAEKSKNIEAAEQFSKDNFTLVCGSTWEPDENNLFKLLEIGDKLKLIIAPHEINNAHINNIVSKLKVPCVLFSKSENLKEVLEAKVLIIDNIGMLSSVYKYGQMAYIGGGFGAGIHNTIEAAVYGIPVIFGPNYQKFQEARDLISNGGGFSYSNPEELNSLIKKYISDTPNLEKSGKAAFEYVNKMKGATKLIIDFLNKI
ncbi:MAG: 3-deoxy-D-manno-octulosonic acid transferase [Bacteroidales bacterium]|nr:3-deoxy-D-manno-octulosonic acid transferase [Bacteroidales bacterium]MBN2817987.1 3-deoxy-D-manno-octulosonic acid transferase [Bacteroidales bacterium]